MRDRQRDSGGRAPVPGAGAHDRGSRARGSLGRCRGALLLALASRRGVRRAGAALRPGFGPLGWDSRVAQAFVDWRTPERSRLFWALTLLGNDSLLAALSFSTVLLLFVWGRRGRAALVAGGLLVAWGVSEGAKSHRRSGAAAGGGERSSICPARTACPRGTPSRRWCSWGCLRSGLERLGRRSRPGGAGGPRGRRRRMGRVRGHYRRCSGGGLVAGLACLPGRPLAVGRSWRLVLWAALGWSCFLGVVRPGGPGPAFAEDPARQGLHRRVAAFLTRRPAASSAVRVAAVVVRGGAVRRRCRPEQD